MIEAANPHCVGFKVEYKGYKCMLAIASTSHKDAHGMRMAKELLEDFSKQIANKYIAVPVNHDDAEPRIGVIVSAKVFTLTDGEAALGIIAVVHDSSERAKAFAAGSKNDTFEEFLPAIDQKMLQIAHDIKMLTYAEPKLSLEDKLESFLRSHTVTDDGLIRTHKYLVTKIGDFRVEVYSDDHAPTHCHIISKQRNINARFTVEPFEWLNMKYGHISNKDKKLIKMFFEMNADELENLKQQAKRLQPGQ